MGASEVATQMDLAPRPGRARSPRGAARAACALANRCAGGAAPAVRARARRRVAVRRTCPRARRGGGLRIGVGPEPRRLADLVGPSLRDPVARGPVRALVVLGGGMARDGALARRSAAGADGYSLPAHRHGLGLTSVRPVAFVDVYRGTAGSGNGGMVHGRGSACPDRDWHVAHRSIRPRPTLNTSVIASRGRGTSAAAVAGKRHSRSTTDEEDLIRQAVMCCLLFLGLCAATAAPALARPACTPSGAGQLRCTIRALDDCEEIKSYPLHLPADARDRDLPRRPADRRRREDSELAPGAALPGVVRDRVDVGMA